MSAGENLHPAQAAAHLGIGLSTLWRYAKTDPTFPKPRRLSARATLFKRDELDAWIEARSAAYGNAS